jgi:hypothetical protein|tara:strand:+ start:959 stop:1945 length:987 start_codon:yes stop_codon:yes gene_type:complete
MSKILRRPMFRGGAVVNSRGTGITSGLDTPKRGMVDGPGGYAGDPADVAMDIYKRTGELFPEPEKKGLSTGDYLRIAATGAEILGAPGRGGGISGALTAAAKPLASLGTDLGRSLDSRQTAAEKTRRSNRALVSDLAGDIYATQQKGNQEYARKQAVGIVENIFKPKIKAAEDSGDMVEKNRLEKELEEKTIAIATDSTPRSEQVMKILIELIKQGEIDVGVATALYPELKTLLPKTEEKTPELKADGGRIGMMEGGDLLEDEMQDPKIPLSYNELRGRLPESIGDDIVKLLSTSYEALSDFAEIRTQADVDNFNVRYQVQLVLPQEA